MWSSYELAVGLRRSLGLWPTLVCGVRAWGCSQASQFTSWVVLSGQSSGRPAQSPWKREWEAWLWSATLQPASETLPRAWGPAPHQADLASRYPLLWGGGGKWGKGGPHGWAPPHSCELGWKEGAGCGLLSSVINKAVSHPGLGAVTASSCCCHRPRLSCGSGWA